MSKSLIPRPNFVIALLSTVVLFILSALATALITMEDPIVSHINAQVYQLVELKQKHSQRTDALIDAARKHEDVDSASVKMMSGEEATRFMSEETGIDFAIEDQNPFSDLLIFKSKSKVDPDFTTLIDYFESHKDVQQVYFQQSYFDEVRQGVRRWKTILSITAFIFIIIAFTILSGLFRLILFSERKKIKTMELVGASQLYVMRPYLWRFLLIGILSMIGACCFFAFIWFKYVKHIQMDWSLFFTKTGAISIMAVWILILAGILLMSISLLRSYMNDSIENLE